MDRRCKDGRCDIHADKLTRLDLPVATIMSDPKREWARISSAYGATRIASSGVKDVDWNEFNTTKYLFTHCSIVSSVALESNLHDIVPVCSDLINRNGNAWSNQVLLATFRSFIGGENYLEHNQVKEFSKGKILDAVLRPVIYEANGSSAEIFFCDIMVATERIHYDLLQEIESGSLDTLSMGTLCPHVTCSKCGGVFDDSDETCQHIQRELLTEYKRNGKTYTVAELCGRVIQVDGKWVGDPKSNRFIEASWVKNPAFQGAVINHFILPPQKQIDISIKVAGASSNWLEDVSENIFQMRVADASGMMMLRLAREEIRKRKRMAMYNRLAQGIK